MPASRAQRTSDSMQRGHELGQHALRLRELVARMQRRQLDRDAVPRRDRLARLDGAAHGCDRGAICLEISLGVGARQRRLAQHVEGIAIVALFLAGGARQRLSMSRPMTNWWPMMRIACLSAARATGSPSWRDQPRIPGTRLADARCDRASTTRPVSMSPQVEALTSSESLSPRCSSQAPRRNLVGDQPIRGLAIRDAQQRFRQAHEDHAFARCQAVLAQEGIQRSAAAGCGAHRLHQPQRTGHRQRGLSPPAVAPDPRARGPGVVRR